MVVHVLTTLILRFNRDHDIMSFPVFFGTVLTLVPKGCGSMFTHLEQCFSTLSDPVSNRRNRPDTTCSLFLHFTRLQPMSVALFSEFILVRRRSNTVFQDEANCLI